MLRTQFHGPQSFRSDGDTIGYSQKLGQVNAPDYLNSRSVRGGGGVLDCAGSKHSLG